MPQYARHDDTTKKVVEVVSQSTTPSNVTGYTWKETTFDFTPSIYKTRWDYVSDGVYQDQGYDDSKRSIEDRNLIYINIKDGVYERIEATKSQTAGTSPGQASSTALDNWGLMLEFFSTNKSDIDAFVDQGTNDLSTTVSAASDFWLSHTYNSKTIKQYILDELSLS